MSLEQLNKMPLQYAFFTRSEFLSKTLEELQSDFLSYIKAFKESLNESNADQTDTISICFKADDLIIYNENGKVVSGGKQPKTSK